jgi:hypothetical protein
MHPTTLATLNTLPVPVPCFADRSFARSARTLLALLLVTTSAAEAGSVTVQGCTGHDLVKVKQGALAPILLQEDLPPAAPFAPTSFEACAVAPSGAPKACAAVESSWIGLTPDGSFDSFRMEGTMNVGKPVSADLALSEQFREITLVVSGTTVSNPFELRLIGSFTESLPQNDQLSYQVRNGFGTLIHQSVPGPFNNLIGLTDGTYTLRMTARAQLPAGTTGSGALSFLFQLLPDDTACGEAVAGSCFSAHATPNCNDEFCCTLLCQSLDPTCCQVAWDQACMQLALENCFTSDEVYGPVADPMTGRRFVVYPPASAPFAFAGIVDDGGTPATIRDAHHEQWLRESMVVPDLFFGQSPRIGLSDAEEEGVYRWFDGTLATYTNWRAEEPNNAGNEDCVEISPYGGWNDVKGSVYQSTIAEFFLPVCGQGGPATTTHGPGCDDPVQCMEICTKFPPCCEVEWDETCVAIATFVGLPTIEAGPFVNPSNGHTYWVLSPTSVTLAQRFARGLGGTLAIPEDAEEAAWIASMIPNPTDEVVIGLNDALEEGVFRTERGQYPRYENWGDGEPNDFRHREDVAAISFQHFGGLWNDVNGADPRRSVVEVECHGDINGDGTVDASDLSILLGGWGTAAGDLTGDGMTDGMDLSVLLGAWGTC